MLKKSKKIVLCATYPFKAIVINLNIIGKKQHHHNFVLENAVKHLRKTSL